MTHEASLTITGLDFDTIRQNLRDYIATKSDFKDYDFTDSAMGTLLDLLAYNTYYNAFYANMSAAESFIDSAQFYDSVVSRAKLVGYKPISAKGAVANVQIRFTATPSVTVPALTIAKNTRFNSTINGVSYAFVTPQSYTVTSNSTSGFSQNIKLIEGTPLIHRFLFTTANTAFILPNANVETSSITVTITSGANVDTYTAMTNITSANSSTKIYYLDADREYKYKVYFGDNVIGKRPNYNSTVAVSYRVCNATRGNGANNFTAAGTVAGESSFSLIVNERGVDGADQEGIESVRFNAPRSFQTQNRAVTASDYEHIILNNFKDIQGVNVWGGEDNVPPIYGKVYISAKPYTGTLISNVKKASIKELLRKYNMQSIQVEFADPTFVYIVPYVNVFYNADNTTLTASQLSTTVANKIISFETSNLNRFEGTFRYSRFLDTVDGAEASILSSTASITLQKRFVPSTSKKNTYTFRYNRQLVTPTGGTAITSSAFVHDTNVASSFFDDDGKGNIRAYYLLGATKVILDARIGTVNYTTGVVTITFRPVSFTGSFMGINASPQAQNIAPVRNQVLLISGTTVNIINDDTGNSEYINSDVSTTGSTTVSRETGLPTVTEY